MNSKTRRDKVYPIEIDNAKIIKEALNECPWYFYKASKRLRKDKKTVMEAITRDPYTVIFVDQKLRNSDPDVQNAIVSTEKYLIKYVDEYGELTEKYKNEIPSMGLQSLLIRNQMIQDNTIINKTRNDDVRDNPYGYERY